MNGREMFRQMTNDKQTSKHNGYATEQTVGRKCSQTLAAQMAKSSLSSNGNNAKDHVD